jgi:hypothetical protein
MTKEALKLALEALETNNKAWKHLADSGDAGFWEAEEQGFYELSVKAITAIKEALAQTEQEQFALKHRIAELEGAVIGLQAQRTWVEIDDEDYIKALELCDFDKDAAFEFFETKLKEKNT